MTSTMGSRIERSYIALALNHIRSCPHRPRDKSQFSHKRFYSPFACEPNIFTHVMFFLTKIMVAIYSFFLFYVLTYPISKILNYSVHHFFPVHKSEPLCPI